ncbi:hypothetical protein [Actinomadura kijaniata]|uniref:hypothetical protein n=1 Tax=Actinomadura kijaniata TaxID=46161 RepID=UPI00082989BE|nr:hypothetical protein [Actinomadura kijaniata]
MSHHNDPEPNGDDNLIEPQGVNAGGAIDRPVDQEPDDDPTAPASGPPDPATVATRDEEMVGVPEQKPGYPGQQRSIDTS